MPLHELLPLLVLATAMTFTPGPNTTLSTALAANGGLGAAMRFCLAVPAGWCLLMLLCAFGLGALVLALPALRWAIKVVGVGYMLWLAWRLAGVSALIALDSSRLKVGFLQGVALQFVNIKAWMISLSIFGGWVADSVGSEGAVLRLLVVLAVLAFYAFTSNFTYALVGSLLRGWPAKGRRLLLFNRLMAALLTATALWMLAA